MSKKVYFDELTGQSVEEVGRGKFAHSEVVFVHLKPEDGLDYYVSERLLNTDRFEEVVG